MLARSDRPLWERYDVAVLDLDGVVYIGAEAVPGAPGHLARVRDAGMKLAYVTNNAARPPSVVADHLSALGVPADASDVVNSAQAAARLLSDRLPAGSPVYVIGGLGLEEALREQGLTPVQDLAADPVAVVSGYNPDLRWRVVMNGAVLVARGLPWVATNMDMSVPTDVGKAPGNGVLVNAVASFAGREPEVAGKPLTPLFDETRIRVGGRRPLVIGDRLDTDIEGANAAGLDSLLVLTGVTGLRELVAAAPHQRPTYLAMDLAGLGEPHPAPEGPGEAAASDTGFVCGGWRAWVADAALHAAPVAGGTEHTAESHDSSASGAAGAAPREADWWRAIAAAAWHHLDDTGAAASTDTLESPMSNGSVEAASRREEEGAEEQGP
jgi:HAD superfamily hydrolase (TIGR01450 family)